mmetsp:Transcript_60296/g.140921  ORF Transcript_60296/g.140921 Transcript_60296/m.140921 type:complete len:181 (-) Transcript_60296:343-885(-)
MAASGKFTRPEIDLSEDATTLLFKLTERLSLGDFLIRLHEICGYSMEDKPYDFVHLPWQKLAVVNFSDPERCRSCFNAVTARKTRKAACICDVREAIHQGLLANLTCYWAKSSQSHYDSPPMVCLDGEVIFLTTTSTSQASAHDRDQSTVCDAYRMPDGVVPQIWECATAVQGSAIIFQL